MPIGPRARRASSLLPAALRTFGRSPQISFLAVMLAACSRAPAAPTPAPAQASAMARSVGPLDGSTQMVLVVTPAWDSTSGSLRRFERATPAAAWRQVGRVVPIVVGRTGLAWDDRQGTPTVGEPVKREGDGR